VTLGKNSSLAGLGGTIYVGGGKALVIDDSADTSFNGYTVTSQQQQNGTVHYVQWGSTYVAYDTMGSVTVNGGSGGNRFDVESTSAPLTLNTGTGNNTVYVAGAAYAVNINDQATAGTDTIKIGTGGTLTTIAAPVNISQASGSSAKIALNIDDRWESAAETINITSNQVAFTGLPATTVNFQGVNLSSLMIEDPWGEANTIDLMSLPPTITHVDINTKGTHDTKEGLTGDILFDYPLNWGATLPQGVILSGQQVQGM
jgi:hypothetical protein